jgi:hypothetical protein
MPIGNLALQGQPNLPYPDVRQYAGSDSFIDMTFLDHTQTAVVPTSISWQLDDLTNAQNMIPLTSVPSGSLPTQAGQVYTLQIPGSEMQMTYPWQGSQICQLSITATALDSVTNASFSVTKVGIIELVAIATPTGLI